jgi:hypothetical protein
MPKIQPSVNQIAEFFEIINDFRDPRDAVREAISNAFDAKATELSAEVKMADFLGDQALVLIFKDNGEGMVPSDPGLSTPSLDGFFGLGHSTRRGDKGTIGEKGHGTKTFFNSKRIEVTTWRDGVETYALMDNPRGELQQGRLPEYEWDDSKRAIPPDKTGTEVVIWGYNRNQRKGFSHHELRDFILWFTKFGSIELELGINHHKGKRLKLRGLGAETWEELLFGHQFACEDFNIKSLRQKDPGAPTKYFVKKWFEKGIPVKNFPDVHVDIVFYIEGDKAKEYNPMIRRQGRKKKEGMYAVEERYGLWACKDNLPIQRVNEWIAKGQRAITKYHGFVNCQDFKLTANRGDIGNTGEDLLKSVSETTVDWFENTVRADKIYRQYEEELEREDFYNDPKQEEEEFKRRKKKALAKRVSTVMNKQLLRPAKLELIEPRQEVGVLGLFYTINALAPELFNFHIVDYDTRRGEDALVVVKQAPEIDRESLRFVEFKRSLEREFNHSFRRLGAIVCWECNLGSGEKVTDISGEERTLKVINPGPKAEYTRYILAPNAEGHSVEVYVLRDYLKERCSIEFGPRAS